LLSSVNESILLMLDQMVIFYPLQFQICYHYMKLEGSHDSFLSLTLLSSVIERMQDIISDLTCYLKVVLGSKSKIYIFICTA